MTLTKWPALIAVVLALTTASCGGDSGSIYGSPPAPPPPPPGPPPPPPPPSPTGAVDVIDDSFNPQTVNITRGGTVTWTWRGAVQHNVTFQDGMGSSASQSNGTLDRTFSAAGTFRYRCTIHSTGFGSGMSGSVVVQ